MCHQVSYGEDVIEFSKFLLQLKNHKPGSKNMCGFFMILTLERIMTFYSVKSSCILLNKNINLIKTKRNRKWKILHTVLERQALCFSWCKNWKLKVKLWWVGARERKKEDIFCTAYCPKEIFFTHMRFISRYSVLNTLSEYTYFFLLIKKHYLIHFFACF